MTATVRLATVEWRLLRREPLVLFFGVAFPRHPARRLRPRDRWPGPRPRRDQPHRGVRADPRRASTWPSSDQRAADDAGDLPRARHPAPPGDDAGRAVADAVGAARGERRARRRRPCSWSWPSRASPSTSPFPVMRSVRARVPADRCRALRGRAGIASVAPTARAANVVGTLAFFPLMFFAGLWVPREAMGDTLRALSDSTPLGAASAALQDAMAGSFPEPSTCSSCRLRRRGLRARD